MPQAGLKLEVIEGGAIAGVSWRVKIANLARLISSLPKVNQILGRFDPQVILLTGGYVNGPVASVAWARRIPAVIYLPDIEPGMAIRTLSRLVRKVACTTETSLEFFPVEKATVTGYPVRPEIRRATAMTHEEALASFDLDPTRKTLFVFGGSRGARSINRALMAALPSLLSDIQVVHVSGTLGWNEVEVNAQSLSIELRRYYRPFPYLHERMGNGFQAADLVLARAGASMLGECPAFGVPAVLVPYPYAWRYQIVNADYLVEKGAAVIIEDEKLVEDLLPTVMDLLRNRARLSEMSANARKLDRPDAGDNLARVLFSLAKRAEK